MNPYQSSGYFSPNHSLVTPIVKTGNSSFTQHQTVEQQQIKIVKSGNKSINITESERVSTAINELNMERDRSSKLAAQIQDMLFQLDIKTKRIAELELQIMSIQSSYEEQIISSVQTSTLQIEEKYAAIIRSYEARILQLQEEIHIYYNRPAQVVSFIFSCLFFSS